MVSNNAADAPTAVAGCELIGKVVEDDVVFAECAVDNYED